MSKLKESKSMSEKSQTLEDIERHCWRLIYHGALSGKNPMHYLFVASQGADGINLRTVVLRSADPALRILRFHTDRRSVKHAEILADPRLSLLLYDQLGKIQLRMTGIASIHAEDAIADEAWDQTILSSRRIYLSTASPSSISAEPSSGLPPHLEERLPDEAESEAGRMHFCVVEVQIRSLDWLNLSAFGHRRAKFLYDDQGAVKEQHWLIP
jgi:pyridoxine/pyridoxamine 5'-phosphate oxidase